MPNSRAAHETVAASMCLGQSRARMYQACSQPAMKCESATMLWNPHRCKAVRAPLASPPVTPRTARGSSADASAQRRRRRRHSRRQTGRPRRPRRPAPRQAVAGLPATGSVAARSGASNRACRGPSSRRTRRCGARPRAARAAPAPPRGRTCLQAQAPRVNTTPTFAGKQASADVLPS
jgi:hypothetical protein